MSNVYEVDHLSLLSLENEVISDLIIKFVGSDKTLRVHKLILAQVSTVYKLQLYGELSENARAEGDFSGSIEVIEEQEFSYETYYIFIRHIYGDKVIIKNCSSYETLLQLLQMANLYLVQKLADLVHKRITDLKMTMGILLPSLETALAYRKLDGFDNICDTVDKKIVATFSALPVIEQHRFYKLQRQDNPDLVAALIQLMAEKEPATSATQTEAEVASRKFHHFYQNNKEDKPELVNALVDLMSDFVLGKVVECTPKEVVGCTNCKMPAGKCKHGKPLDAVPHQGMRFLFLGSICRVESVAFVFVAFRAGGGREEYDLKLKREYDGKMFDLKYPEGNSRNLIYHCKI